MRSAASDVTPAPLPPGRGLVAKPLLTRSPPVAIAMGIVWEACSAALAAALAAVTITATSSSSNSLAKPGAPPAFPSPSAVRYSRCDTRYNRVPEAAVETRPTLHALTGVEQPDDSLPCVGLRAQPGRQKKREGESNGPRKNMPPFQFNRSSRSELVRRRALRDVEACPPDTHKVHAFVSASTRATWR